MKGSMGTWLSASRREASGFGGMGVWISKGGREDRAGSVCGGGTSWPVWSWNTSTLVGWGSESDSLVGGMFIGRRTGSKLPCDLGARQAKSSRRIDTI